MVSVLFVDDNLAGLEILRERFGGCNDSWQMAFVPRAKRPARYGGQGGRRPGGQQPPHRHDGRPAVPGQQVGAPPGGALGSSEPNDRGAMLSTLPVANKCLSNVCGTEILNLTVEHTTKLQAKLYSDATRKMVADMGGLPSLPATLSAMDEALADESTSLGQVADIISGDVAMAARARQLVNSSSTACGPRCGTSAKRLPFWALKPCAKWPWPGPAFRAFTPSSLLPPDWLASFNSHSLVVATSPANWPAAAPATQGWRRRHPPRPR